MQYSEEAERGYPWFTFRVSSQLKRTFLVTLIILAVSIGFFVWGTHVSDDMSGDSFVGLVFAVASTIFMFLAAVSFSLRRRASKRSVGELNATLNWHVCFGVVALVMVFLHAFGNLNPRTGTYALYGMIALVISGAVGRVLDRMLPRVIAQNVRNTLTVQGEDRIEAISHNLQSVALQHSVLTRASAQQYMGAIGDVQYALKREAFFRYMIRYWRIFHIVLAVVTVGLTLWHIEYALSLIIPALQKYGFGYLLPWP